MKSFSSERAWSTEFTAGANEETPDALASRDYERHTNVNDISTLPDLELVGGKVFCRIISISAPWYV